MTAEVLDKFSELTTTALGPVAALAWNAAIQQLFTRLFGEAGGALAAKFGYAGMITLVVIFATITVGRAAERAKKLEAEQAKGIWSSTSKSGLWTLLWDRGRKVGFPRSSTLTQWTRGIGYPCERLL